MSSVCIHPPGRVEVRKFPPTGLGARVPTFQRQCLDCLEVLDLRPLDPTNLPLGAVACNVPICEFDRKAERKARGRTGLGGRGNSKRRTLEAFYRSAAWRNPKSGQRARVMARDGWLCQDCAARGIRTPATDAAHIRYADPVERTPDSDVKASCSDCNQRERTDRIRRGRRVVE